VTELAKCKGQQGDWLVNVTIDGKTEKLPSAHRYFLSGLRLEVPHFWTGEKHAKKRERYLEALFKHKRIVLTDDEVLVDNPIHAGPDRSHFKRKGYIAVYDVDEIVADAEHGLGFTLTKRVRNCQ
jgi:hypothetical protein